MPSPFRSTSLPLVDWKPLVPEPAAPVQSQQPMFRFPKQITQGKPLVKFKGSRKEKLT